MPPQSAIRSGRIVLWSGASLWFFDVDRRAGAAGQGALHAHHALQVTVAVEGAVAIRVAAGRFEGPVVFVAPDALHAIEPEGRVALLFVEPESAAGAALLSRLAGADVARLAPDALPLRATLSRLWATPPISDEDVASLGRDFLARVAGQTAWPAAVDPRVSRVLDWLAEQPDERKTLPEAARVAGLSEGRFTHLFSQTVGLPFRTYVLWRRLMTAVEAMAKGERLTTAAHAAGFADSAHFSRTFRRMFGVSAQSLALDRAAR